MAARPFTDTIVALRFGTLNDGTDEIHVERGDRIAQAMLVSLPTAHWQSVDELSATERGAGGFGSTGK